MYIVSPKRNYYLHSLGFYCMKGNKHMNEEELKQKEQELKDKETDLTAKEEALKQREDALKESKEDTQALIKQVKDEYDGKLSKLTETYEAKIKERNNVIKQLLSDGNANEPQQNDIIAKINARRLAQNKKW